jgi:hypothetical protein
MVHYWYLSELNLPRLRVKLSQLISISKDNWFMTARYWFASQTSGKAWVVIYDGAHKRCFPYLADIKTCMVSMDDESDYPAPCWLGTYRRGIKWGTAVIA